MNCEEASQLIEAHADHELDTITSSRVEDHLRTCANCRQASEAQQTLGRAIEHAAPYYRASSDLRERIRVSLHESVREDANAAHERTYVGSRVRPSQLRWNWLALAAAVIMATVTASSLSSRLQRSNSDQFLAIQLTASHVRSLMANHLTDVASSDQHTVKPWLDEKLDFAAPVVDLANEGFPLLGGRLDYLENRSVAALVYQRRKHYINLFVWPKDGDTEKRGNNTITRQGYHLRHWSDTDFNYWAVSDVNATELATFEQLFEKQLR